MEPRIQFESVVQRAPQQEHGGLVEASVPRRSGAHALAARLRASAWFAVAAKAVGIGIGMLGLSTIGALELDRNHGIALELPPPRAHAAALGSVWLREDATKPSPSADHAVHHGALPAASSSPRADRASPMPGLAHPHGDTENPSAPTGVTEDGRVILNEATAAELTRLPGVGSKRAESIVALRARLKRFRRVTDLLRVRGIGVRSLKRMLPHLILDRPESEPKPAPESQPKVEPPSGGG